jgi:hypothetical protein
MAVEKIPFFQFASSAPKTPPKTTTTVTADPEDCPFTTSKSLNKDDSLIPTHTEATQAANLIQEPLTVLYRKAKTNKSNKTFIEMSFIKKISLKMNTVIKYLESSLTPAEPDNVGMILKAINELHASIQSLDQKLTPSKMTEDPPSPKTYANVTKANQLPPSEPRNPKFTPPKPQQ